MAVKFTEVIELDPWAAFAKQFTPGPEDTPESIAKAYHIFQEDNNPPNNPKMKRCILCERVWRKRKPKENEEDE